MGSSGPIGAVSLDLDDTLWPVWPAIERAERELLRFLVARAPELAGLDIAGLRKVRDRVFREHPELAFNFSALRRLSFVALLAPHGYGDELVDAAFELFLEVRNQITLYPDSIGALDALGARWPLASLTNGNADLQRIGLADRFKVNLAARDLGAAKPDRRCFDAVATALGFPPGEIAHVGDDPDLDVVGAKRAGMVGVWLNRDGVRWPHPLKPDITIRSLAELVPALDAFDPRKVSGW